MIAEDQHDVVAFLGSSSTHDGAHVARIDTHGAIVFLAGPRAYKLKRAVRFDYLDFSTAERRRAMCEAEVRVNRRTAPTLYRRVVAVTRQPDGTLALGGDGAPLDWVIEMARFPQEALFDRLAETGSLDLDMMPPLAEAIAALHASADRRPENGGLAGMTWVVDGNADGLAEFGAGVLDSPACLRLVAHARAEVERRASLLDARRIGGAVRECHGDLHLGNIVLLDGRPTPFDAVEFDDRISCIDVLYDLAFLLMDLWHRGLPTHANVVWNRYLAETGDTSGIALLPLFLSCRAAVRAKTTVTALQMQTDAQRRDTMAARARAYLALASGFLRPAPPRLVAVGGLSGTGKSTLARELAPVVGAVPGAIVIRTDEIRKSLSGVPPLQRLGPEGYSREMSARVYSTAADRTKAVLRQGHSVIVDAVFARPADREAIERVASELSVPFAGIWLDAPERVLVARVERRRLDPSDATPAVVRQQRQHPTGTMTWHRIDASASAPAVLKHAALHLQVRHGHGHDAQAR